MDLQPRVVCVRSRVPGVPLWLTKGDPHLMLVAQVDHRSFPLPCPARRGLRMGFGVSRWNEFG